jgi:hypothetical protein
MKDAPTASAPMIAVRYTYARLQSVSMADILLAVRSTTTSLAQRCRKRAIHPIDLG